MLNAGGVIACQFERMVFKIVLSREVEIPLNFDVDDPLIEQRDGEYRFKPTLQIEEVLLNDGSVETGDEEDGRPITARLESKMRRKGKCPSRCLGDHARHKRCGLRRRQPLGVGSQRPGRP